MFTKLLNRNHPTTYDDYDEIDSRFCRHGYLHAQCEQCEEEDDCDIDKCMTCGRYRASTSLNQYQSCKAGCVNPNEY